MDSTFGILDAIALLVFAVLIAVAIIIIVFLGQLPARVARQRGHPQDGAIEVASWIGLATFGLLWPLALVWAFVISSAASSLALDHGRQQRLDDDARPGRGPYEPSNVTQIRS